MPQNTCDMSTYYTVLHPEEFTIDWSAFYRTADSMTASTRSCLPCHLNIRYGDDPKHKLDIYLPSELPNTPAPVFVFLHGGGFREGDRAHYGYVSDRLAEHGVVTVVPSYRLSPQAHFPDQPVDIHAVLDWVYRNIGEYDGDPARLYLGGHSAGAILSATVGVDTSWGTERGLPPDLIKGFIPISGGYDLTKIEGLEGYVGDSAAGVKASPLLNIVRPAPRALVAVGSVEPYVASSDELVEKLCEAGVAAELLVLHDMDHDDTALCLAKNDGLTERIIEMING